MSNGFLFFGQLVNRSGPGLPNSCGERQSRLQRDILAFMKHAYSRSTGKSMPPFLKKILIY
jgi:hypothetical protein